MISFFEQLDQQLLLFINSLNTPWLDVAMMHITKLKIFLPLYIWWAYELIRLVKWRGFALFAFCMALLITVTDQTANFSKNNVARYRPTHHLELGQKVHVVNEYRGGQYGFYSGHAANTFGIAMFLFLLFRKKKSVIRYTFFAFAFIASYSRMYLGVHYPFDILIGTLTGLLYGSLIYMLFERLMQRFSWNYS